MGRLGLWVFSWAVVLAPRLALASSSSGGGMPWESPLATLRTSLTGPVAGAVSLIAIVAAGATIIFGGELNEFVKRIAYLVLVLSVLLLANNFISGLGLSAAVI